jgi:F0F1-type ATP synthase membrane subunit b/b'
VTDQSLRRTDELLIELVEMVETARTLPMSSSAVVPRERLLDLLDALRETMPPEMSEARRILATRDDVLQRAREQAEMLVSEAQAHAAEIIEAGRTEHARLLSSTTVQQSARESAEALHAQAQAEVDTARAEAARVLEQARSDAEQYTARVRAEVDAYAAKLAADAEDYTDSTLAELAQTLNRAAATAEQGRLAVARRRAEGWRPGPAE